MAIVDTNADPEIIDYPIPGNDDAIRAIRVMLQKLVDAIVSASGEARMREEVEMAGVSSLTAAVESRSSRAERIRLSGFFSQLSALDISSFMEINPQTVKQLREKTNAGFMDCKARPDRGGRRSRQSETLLRTKGIASASKGNLPAPLRKASSPPIPPSGQGWRSRRGQLRNRF